MAAPSRIELRHLRYFLAVYEELHFGRAAKRLNIAQPPLSQAIRQLETELGIPLLVRTSRVVRTTPAGDVFAAEVRKVLRSFDSALAEARRAGGTVAPIRIGCVTYIPTRRVRDLLAFMKKRDSSLRAEVMHMTGPEQVGRLRAGEIDFGVFASVEDHEGLEWEPLLPGEPLAVFLPKGHRLAAKPVLTPLDLADETVVLYPRKTNPAFYDAWMRLMDRIGYRFARRYETNPDPRDLLLAVENGMGIAIAPVSFEELGDAAGSLIRCELDPPLALPDTIVAWRSDPSGALLARVRAIRGAASELRRTASFEAAPG